MGAPRSNQILYPRAKTRFTDVRRLNEENVPAPRGGRWHFPGVKRALSWVHAQERRLLGREGVGRLLPAPGSHALRWVQVSGPGDMTGSPNRESPLRRPVRPPKRGEPIRSYGAMEEVL